VASCAIVKAQHDARNAQEEELRAARVWKVKVGLEGFGHAVVLVGARALVCFWAAPLYFAAFQHLVFMSH